MPLPAPDPPLPPVRVNLYSDTQTRPSAGDEGGDDARPRSATSSTATIPTVNALCDRMAALPGKEAAMFLPSGTMCNQIAILTHCRPGDEILAHETSHIIANEGGGPGRAGRRRGARSAWRARPVRRRHAARRVAREAAQRAAADPGRGRADRQRGRRLGLAGGIAERVLNAAHEHGMATHMDGARLMNAVVASGVTAQDMAADCDSVWLDFTKGLGAPLGAVLCGSAAFIDAAWRWKQRLGGSLRQAGICAAACLYALDHNIDRLAEDHANARVLARGLAQVPGLVVEEPETNLVFFDTAAAGVTADALADKARFGGVMLSTVGPYRVRACTHLDVDTEGVELAIRVITHAVAN